MFGEDSKVIIESVIYSTNRKEFVIHTRLNATFSNESEINESNYKDLEIMYPAGLNLLVEQSWKYLGFDVKINIVNKLEVI